MSCQAPVSKWHAGNPTTQQVVALRDEVRLLLRLQSWKKARRIFPVNGLQIRG